MFVVKTGPEMTNKTFRLPVDLVQQLDEVAKQKKISMNEQPSPPMLPIRPRGNGRQQGQMKLPQPHQASPKGGGGPR